MTLLRRTEPLPRPGGDDRANVRPCGTWLPPLAAAWTDACDAADPTGCRGDGDVTGDGTPCNVAVGVVTDCDWYGDYECVRAVNGGGDVCDFLVPTRQSCADVSRCDWYALPPDNPTDMQCRDPVTGGLGVPPAAGRCLDLTTSGGLCPGVFDGGGHCVP